MPICDASFNAFLLCLRLSRWTPLFQGWPADGGIPEALTARRRQDVFVRPSGPPPYPQDRSQGFPC